MWCVDDPHMIEAVQALLEALDHDNMVHGRSILKAYLLPAVGTSHKVTSNPSYQSELSN